MLVEGLRSIVPSGSIHQSAFMGWLWASLCYPRYLATLGCQVQIFSMVCEELAIHWESFQFMANSAQARCQGFMLQRSIGWCHVHPGDQIWCMFVAWAVPAAGQHHSNSWAYFGHPATGSVFVSWPRFFDRLAWRFFNPAWPGIARGRWWEGMSQWSVWKSIAGSESGHQDEAWDHTKKWFPQLNGFGLGCVNSKFWLQPKCGG